MLQWLKYWRRWAFASWLFFLGLVFIFVCLPTCAVVKYVRDHDVAMDYAADWASRIENAKLVECVHHDSDYDGYVSCTVYRGSADPLYIECAAALSLNEGCRGRKGE
ncbi:hypothetical protein LCGC14_1924370 [marine sediment metagenome]|uniref:Uncharacterized protein n=1 Tax=marine sediment metagenome TaxID=412755 RepID=A0A0F9FPP6_9ZZZZ